MKKLNKIQENSARQMNELMKDTNEQQKKCFIKETEYKNE